MRNLARAQADIRYYPRVKRRLQSQSIMYEIALTAFTFSPDSPVDANPAVVKFL